jgi:hypothetical protein
MQILAAHDHTAAELLDAATRLVAP